MQGGEWWGLGIVLAIWVWIAAVEVAAAIYASGEPDTADEADEPINELIREAIGAEERPADPTALDVACVAEAIDKLAMGSPDSLGYGSACDAVARALAALPPGTALAMVYSPPGSDGSYRDAAFVTSPGLSPALAWRMYRVAAAGVATLVWHPAITETDPRRLAAFARN